MADEFDATENAYAEEFATVVDPDVALRNEFGAAYQFATMRVTADGSKVGAFEYGCCYDCHAMVEFRRAALRKHLDFHARLNRMVRRASEMRRERR